MLSQSGHLTGPSSQTRTGFPPGPQAHHRHPPNDPQNFLGAPQGSLATISPTPQPLTWGCHPRSVELGEMTKADYQDRFGSGLMTAVSLGAKGQGASPRLRGEGPDM